MKLLLNGTNWPGIYTSVLQSALLFHTINIILHCMQLKLVNTTREFLYLVRNNTKLIHFWCTIQYNVLGHTLKCNSPTQKHMAYNEIVSGQWL